jgi:oligopeptidase B
VILRNATHSPDQTLFAWAEDAHGSETFPIFVKDIATGDILPNHIHDALGDLVFSPDSQWIFWIWRDENSRPTKIFMRLIHGGSDKLLYREHNHAFLLS